MSYTVDENVVASVYLTRQKRERRTFIIFVIALLVIIALTYIAWRILKYRQAALEEDDSRIVST